ncbi:MAG TPA: NAD-dependent epimerase/dehydratase family protein [Rhodanobacteraceae bacterium]|nr:NAD-dependent epimerase/dehydratase family protein [Rhodanobacteraceae bacterium]
MKVIVIGVIGASGTIGTEVAKAPTARKHEVVSTSRHGEIKVEMENPESIRRLFDNVRDVDAVACCAGDAVSKPFAELGDADYGLGLRINVVSPPWVKETLAKLGTDAESGQAAADVAKAYVAAVEGTHQGAIRDPRQAG